MPDLHQYPSFELSPESDFISGEKFIRPNQTSFVDFMAITAGHMFDPITILLAIVVVVISSSLRKAVIFGTISGFILASIGYYLSIQQYRDYPFIDGWLGQIVASIALTALAYGLKLCWLKLNQIQDEADDYQAYLSEVQDPNFKTTHEHKFSSPVGSEALKCIEKQSNPKPPPLNPIQRMIVSVMAIILMFVLISTIAKSFYYKPYDWSDTGWIWVLGITSLTGFEVWLWRDQKKTTKTQ